MDDIRQSVAGRLTATLTFLRSRVNRNRSAAAGVHNATDSVSGLPLGATAQEIMERISEDLARLENMDFENLGNSQYVQEQLRNLEVRFELLRQSMQDSQASRRTSSQFNVLGHPPRSFDDLIGIGPATNRFPVNFHRGRDSMGSLERPQSQRPGYQRNPSPPRYEARTRSSTNTTIRTLRPNFATETFPPEYDESGGLGQSNDALVQRQTFLDSYTVSSSAEEAPSNTAAAAGEASTSRRVQFNIRPSLQGISPDTRARMAQIPDTSGVQHRSSLIHYSL
ncbi:hypothetical protein HBH69_237330 [Parastagonospora nodorum]|nr:hypothetical protein HBI79_100060 [Parastagonospora nodorum]KAH5136229.1 hypothetical protein HBH69_237330 [Parastagonospora nodorum]KAH5991906.1 hypothetical protein HBI82_187320 [Parastagonospora nodorum]KAH6362013.1 hypothetical protein HBI34_181830 [Parastagonospora nodorum]